MPPVIKGFKERKHLPLILCNHPGCEAPPVVVCCLCGGSHCLEHGPAHDCFAVLRRRIAVLNEDIAVQDDDYAKLEAHLSERIRDLEAVLRHQECDGENRGMYYRCLRGGCPAAGEPPGPRCKLFP